ncbi:MAG: GIY-YIG nuclease family protein [Bacteroidales bacterium]|nr:GIY-YIG nuclease family protein [Bacteroidales bacterium]
MIYYIYILQSKKDNNFYTGYTSDLKRRLEEHNNGKVTSTKHRRPLKLIYFEGCLSQKDALHREKYLKTSWGKRYVKNRIKNYLTGRTEATTTEISKEKKPKTFNESKHIANQGGTIAGNTRKEIEEKTGKGVISSTDAKVLENKNKEIDKNDTK